MTRESINLLADNFEAILSELIGGRKVAILADFPNHPNVGDSAIYVGEMIALKEILGLTNMPSDIFDVVDYGLNSYVKPGDGDVILIHGGGNFGDLWPQHQNLREELISSFPRSRIIQLPQSIHYQSVDNLRKSSEIINKHTDFHLMVRDRNSQKIAMENFSCNVVLCPDAALSIRNINRLCEPRVNELHLLRSDKEKKLLDPPLDVSESIMVEDWFENYDSILFKCDHFLKRFAKKFPHFSRNFLFRKIRFFIYYKLALFRVNTGVAQLSKAKFVVTDRLHGHILCALIGIDHRCLDNSYGKISSFNECWGL